MILLSSQLFSVMSMVVVVSEKRVKELIQPFWDLIYGYGLLILVVLGMFLLITVRRDNGRVALVEGPADSELNETTSQNWSNPDQVDATAIMNHVHHGDHYDNVGLDPAFEGPILSHEEEYEHFEAVFVCLVIGFSSCLLLIELCYQRVFFNFVLVKFLCQLSAQLSDLNRPDFNRNPIALSAVVYKTQDKRFLAILFHSNNVFRLVSILTLLILTSVNFVQINNLSSADQMHHVAGVLLLIFLVLLTLTLAFGLAWSYLQRNSLWGRFILTYTKAIEKFDVVRGRSVPTPPFKSSKDLARVMECLNPYAANPNVQLILDLLAQKNGLGMALKSLVHLEMDVYDNFKPDQLTLSVHHQDLVIQWKHPPALLYFVPVPKDLRLHFAIEVTCLEEPKRILRMIGYEETRYVQQVWKSSRPASVEIKGQEKLSYEEAFEGLSKARPVLVEVWTCVDGQLIAKSSAQPMNPRQKKANLIPKPPRSKGRAKSPAPEPLPAMSSSSDQTEVPKSRTLDSSERHEKRQKKELVVTPAESSNVEGLDEDSESPETFDMITTIKTRSLDHTQSKKRLTKTSIKRSRSCLEDIADGASNKGFDRTDDEEEEGEEDLEASSDFVI